MTDTSTDPHDRQSLEPSLSETTAAVESVTDVGGGGEGFAEPGDEEQATDLSTPGPQIEYVAFVWDERLWREGFGVRHPLRPKRLLRLHRLLESSGALNWRESQVVPPDPLDPAVLGEYHRPDYVQAVRALSEGAAVLLHPDAYGFGPRSTPVTHGMWEAHTAHVAAALTAARVVREGSVSRAFTPAGGFHHARPAKARAGHIFNDLVLVIKSLLAADLKVAYLDLDATHGDAVQDAFYDTNRVFTISLHEGPQYLFPRTGWPQEIGEGAGKGYTVNLALPPATGDDHYLWAFEEVVPPLLNRFRPDVIVTQTGLNAHFAEELTHLSLTTRGFSRLWRRIRELAPRWVAVGGGGLNLDVAARGWSLAYAIIAGREAALPRRLPRRYAERWGAGEFQDEPPEAPPQALDEYVWNTVRGQVAFLQRSLFPLHKLQSPPLVTGVDFEPLERPAVVSVPASLPRAPSPPVPQAIPARRPPHHQPSGPILAEPEDHEEDEELAPDLEERQKGASAGEAAGPGKRRRGRRRGRHSRRPATPTDQAQATQGATGARRAGAREGEGAGGKKGRPASSSGTQPRKGRRRSSRRGRSRKKSE